MMRKPEVQRSVAKTQEQKKHEREIKRKEKAKEKLARRKGKKDPDIDDVNEQKPPD